MHISEGVLSAPVLLGGAVLTVGGTALGIKKLNYERIMTASLLTATFFVASLIHVPVVVSNVHLTLNGILGLVLGWASFPAILVALLLQAIFFQFGGIVVLGVNTLVMALPAICCHYLLRPWLKKKGKKLAIAAFLGGALAILLSTLLMALALILTDTGYYSTAKITLVSQLPVMLIEGFVTMFTITFILKVQPELIRGEQL